MQRRHLKIIPFEVEHAVEIVRRGITERTLTCSEELARRNGALYRERGPAFSGLDGEGRVVGAGGIVMLWKGVGEAWVLFSREMRRYPHDAYDTMGTFIHRISGEAKLRRVQAQCRVDLPEARRYLENLGFACEATLRKYAEDGSDMTIYAIFPEVRE